jgi:hypothetical protein
MRYTIIAILVLAMCLLSFPAFSQTGPQTQSDTALLGLPGDNLDLFATLSLFQKSKTIEEFEKSLNLQETGINNLDLNLDNKVDFIKVVTRQDGTDFTFILQVDVSEKEKQDVAVILVSKDKDGKVIMQAVGDKDLYGKDYVVEPAPPAPAVTANPAYAGPDPVTTTAPATTTVVVVESAPIVQYVYSPVYVPYYPPYYYSYYPPYYAAFTVMAVGIYRHNNYYHHYGYHGGYHGGYGNTVVIHNTNNFNNYNNSRNSSNTVNHNNANGNYNRNNASARPSTGTSASTRPSTGSSASARPSTGTSASTRPSTGTSSSSRQAASPSTSQSKASSSSARPSTGASSTARPNTSYNSSSSRSGSSSASRSMGSSRSMGGGGGGRRR